MRDQEINAAVARKLGWQQNVTLPVDVTGTGNKSFAHWYRDGEISSCAVPANYSTSIEAAWEIVEHIYSSENLGPVFTIERDGPRWSCSIFPGSHEYADTAPMAICLAFLKLSETK